MKSIRILVADDEVGIRDLMHDALGSVGHNVVCVDNGVDAVEWVKTNPVDVVFLDIRMPKGDGLTALKNIIRQRPSLPVVMITGCGQAETIDETIESGCFACLVKPFSIRDVLAILDMLQIKAA